MCDVTGFDATGEGLAIHQKIANTIAKKNETIRKFETKVRELEVRGLQLGAVHNLALSRCAHVKLVSPHQWKRCDATAGFSTDSPFCVEHFEVFMKEHDDASDGRVKGWHAVWDELSKGNENFSAREDTGIKSAVAEIQRLKKDAALLRVLNLQTYGGTLTGLPPWLGPKAIAKCCGDLHAPSDPPCNECGWNGGRNNKANREVKQTYPMHYLLGTKWTPKVGPKVIYRVIFSHDGFIIVMATEPTTPFGTRDQGALGFSVEEFLRLCDRVDGPGNIGTQAKP